MSGMKICTYVYPVWHEIQERAELYGAGWTEWQLLNERTRLYGSHQLTAPPLWGCYDDTQEKDVQRQIQTALKYGVDAFIYLYYWSPSGIQLKSALDTYLAVSQGTEHQFALIWPLRNCRRVVKRPLNSQRDYEADREFEITSKDVHRFFEETIEQFFLKKNYLCVDGSPVLYLYKYYDFIEHLGESCFRSCIQNANELLKRKGFQGLYLVGCTERHPDEETDVSNLGFKALSSYVLLPDFHRGPPIQDYQGRISEKFLWVDQYQKNTGIPYLNSIPVGFDASSRGEAGIEVPSSLGEKNDYPWFPIVENLSVEVFKEYFKKGLGRALEKNLPLLNVASWNEWTQGHVLEPDEKLRFSYLEAIREVKKHQIKASIDSGFRGVS